MLSPRSGRVVVVSKVDDDEIHAAGTEKIVVVVIVRSVVAAVVGAAGEARNAEVGIVEDRIGGVAVTTPVGSFVVIAGVNAVGDARVFQDFQRPVGNAPLGCVPPLSPFCTMSPKCAT